MIMKRIFPAIAVAAISAALMLNASKASAEELWTLDIKSINADGTSEQMMYKPLAASEVSKKWNLCIIFPHVKDPYYIAFTYGAISEAKRLGAKLTVLAAKGYGDLTGQISLVEDCVAQGADGVSLTAVSTEGLNKIISETVKKGVPVIDLGIGVTAPDVTGSIAASYYGAGESLGKYMAGKHPKGSGMTKMLYLAGPAGSGWVEDAARGLQDALKGSDLEISKVVYGDSGKTVQMKLIEDSLQAYPDVSYIAGIAPAAEGAVQILREQGMTDKVQVASFYTTPGVYQGVKGGSILAMTTDYNLTQARMAIDTLVRVLENKNPVLHIIPGFETIDGAMVGAWKPVTTLAPADWKLVFKVD